MGDEPLRVLVCGGRRYQRGDLVDRCLDRLHHTHGITVVIHGCAEGADSLAGDWARRRGVNEERYPIAREAMESGSARNGRMLLASRPDLVVHFPGRTGTGDMIRRAAIAGVTLLGGLAPPVDRQLDILA